MRVMAAMLIGAWGGAMLLGQAAPSAKETIVERIAAAVPERAAAAPKKPRRLLVFTYQPGYYHTVTPHLSAAIETMGKKTGAYEATVSDDPSVFEPEDLGRFDAVVMNNNCGPYLLPRDFAQLPEEKKKEAKAREARLRKSLEDLVRGGRGLVGLHSCLYTPDYADWPEGAELIGGLVPSHPWHQKIRVRIDDPAHPLCAAFGGKDFEIFEETYQVLDPYSREKVHVLLTLDPASVDLAKGARKDNDYALAWVKAYGKGRVFYSALTHHQENLASPALLRFYLDAIQFALGDLEADTTPSAKARKPEAAGAKPSTE